MLDRLSVQFSTDKNISGFSSPPENVTLQYSLNAWGLNPHSCGGLWGQKHATAHHNLWAQNHTRNRQCGQIQKRIQSAKTARFASAMKVSEPVGGV